MAVAVQQPQTTAGPTLLRNGWRVELRPAGERWAIVWQSPTMQAPEELVYESQAEAVQAFGRFDDEIG